MTDLTPLKKIACTFYLNKEEKALYVYPKNKSVMNDLIIAFKEMESLNDEYETVHVHFFTEDETIN